MDSIINQVKKFQEIFLNSWPAKDYYFINGWILRFNDGITDRANSVIPLSYWGTDVNNDIDEVERIYEKVDLIPSFMMFDYCKPKNLKSLLIEREYSLVSPTKVMIARPKDLKFSKLDKIYNYHFFDFRSAAFSKFIPRYTQWSDDDQKIIKEINERIIIPEKKYIIVKSNGMVIASIMAVLVKSKYLYIADVLVHPNFRQKKIATTMLYKLLKEWANKKETQYLWLQVEESNRIAQKMYQNLGMTSLFKYSYFKKRN